MGSVEENQRALFDFWSVIEGVNDNFFARIQGVAQALALKSSHDAAVQSTGSQPWEQTERGSIPLIDPRVHNPEYAVQKPVLAVGVKHIDAVIEMHDQAEEGTLGAMQAYRRHLQILQPLPSEWMHANIQEVAKLAQLNVACETYSFRYINGDSLNRCRTHIMGAEVMQDELKRSIAEDKNRKGLEAEVNSRTALLDSYTLRLETCVQCPFMEQRKIR